MGLSESTMSDCISNVLGSFNCTCKSKCCDYCKFLKFYYHCRTTQGIIISERKDEITPSISESPLTNKQYKYIVS